MLLLERKNVEFSASLKEPRSQPGVGVDWHLKRLCGVIALRLK